MPAALSQALSCLNRRDKFILALLVLAQFLLSILDLLAIALFGLLATLIANPGGSTSLPGLPQISAVMPILSEPSWGVTIAVVAACALIVKSGVSFFLTRRAFVFLARRQAQVSSELVERLLDGDLLRIQSRSSQEISVSVVRGTMALIPGVLGQSIVMLGEAGLVAVLLVALFFFDPVLTLFVGLYFGLVALCLHLLLARWSLRLGQSEVTADTSALALLQESLSAFKEVAVAGKRSYYVQAYRAIAGPYAAIQANRSLVQMTGKYVFEVAMVVGAGLLILGLLSQNSVQAVAATVVVFFAAASRIMPALLRIQGASVAYKIFAGIATPSLSLIRELSSARHATLNPSRETGEKFVVRDFAYPGFSADIQIERVSFTYPGRQLPALDGISLRVRNGDAVAIVGPTGAGKTTLVDVILGILSPDEGYVRISSRSPRDAVQKWSGVIAYIPQTVSLFNSTVRANVAIGLPPSQIDDSQVWEALRGASLEEVVRDLPAELDTRVGERGVRLSGGQRQRLGIARALYSRPRLVVMDEATSALDSVTEAAITEMLRNLSGKVTRVVIAHRLATVRSCDQVVYLDNGKIVANASFEEVRSVVPDFDQQAKLLGL